MTTPAEVEAIHLAADEAVHALAAAELNIDATMTRLALAGRVLSDLEGDGIMQVLFNLQIARDAAVAASDAILLASAKASRP